MTESAIAEVGAARRRSRRLTEAAIKRIRPPAAGRLEIADAIVAGLYLRITEKDVRTWALLYRRPGQPRLQRLTLGRWPVVGVADARTRARHALVDAAAGNDPVGKKRIQRERQADTFERVVAEFTLRFLKPRQKRWWATEAIIKNKLVTAWRGWPIGQIRKADVLKLLDREMDAGRARTANQTLQLSRQLFRWAIQRGYVEQDPTAGIERPAKEQSRDRVLSDGELGAIWHAAVRLGYPFGSFVRLLILLGQRRSEVAEMRWSELDLDKMVWMLPRERTKNDRPHDVPLSEPAAKILQEMPKLDDRVFPSVRKNSSRAISGFSKAKRRLDQLAHQILRERAYDRGDDPDQVEPIRPWVLHDLRRTLVTGLAEAGTQPHVIEAVVNHISGHRAGVAGVYNRATYAAEKQAALLRWGEHIIVVANASLDVVETQSS